MRNFLILLVMLFLLSGCMFGDHSGQKSKQVTTAEVNNISPALYIVLAVFVLILVGSVWVSLYLSANGKINETITPMIAAGVATIVVLLLCA